MGQTSWLSALVEDLGQALFGDESESLGAPKVGRADRLPNSLMSLGEVYQHSNNALVKVHTLGQYPNMSVGIRNGCEDFISAVVIYDYRIRLFSQKWHVPFLSYVVWRGTMSLLIPGAMAELDVIEPPLRNLGAYEQHADTSSKLLALHVALLNT